MVGWFFFWCWFGRLVGVGVGVGLVFFSVLTKMAALPSPTQVKLFKSGSVFNSFI